MIVLMCQAGLRVPGSKKTNFPHPEGLFVFIDFGRMTDRFLCTFCR
ncbi:hypothetical protein [Paenibacillus ferrarius]